MTPFSFAIIIGTFFLAGIALILLFKKEEQSKKALEEKYQLKEKMTHSIVHELRAPLTAIKDASSLLVKTENMAHEEQQKMLQLVYDQSKLLLEQVSLILDAGKLNEGKLTIGKTIGNIGEIIRDEMMLFLPQAQRKQITLTADIDPSLPPFSFDQIRIQQVINNLVSNALKYTHAGGTIHLSARMVQNPHPPHAKEAEVSIQDTGQGISEEQQAFVFSRFSDISKSKKIDPKLSSGLGLYISKGIIEAHGGRIELASEVGVGTTVTFNLPIDTISGQETSAA